MKGGVTTDRQVNGLETIYQHPAIRDRILDYLGCEQASGNPTALYVARCDGCLPTEIEKISIDDWLQALESPTDLARSLEDKENIIVHLDIEYVNFDSASEAYLDPWRTFGLQEPVINVIEEELVRYGISPLHLLTGQGHHFVWQIGRNSTVAERLRAEASPSAIIGNESDTSELKEHEASFEGIGLMIEFLAQRIKQRASEVAEIPVEVTALHVGGGPTKKREMISIDISEYGDPLAERIIRIPFTHYRKPWQSGLITRLGLESVIPKFVALPMHEIDTQQAIRIRHDTESVISLARRSIVRIPTQEAGTSRLLDAYMQSNLREFHCQFYSERYDPENHWPSTYGQIPNESFPRCVQNILMFPNDWLLKPSGIQLVTRYLLSMGWHPRHIAGAIRSKIGDPDYEWLQGYWHTYNPATRADFYVRLFAGLIATGVDEAIDFNCVSTQEKGFCPLSGCQHNLSDYRDLIIPPSS